MKSYALPPRLAQRSVAVLCAGTLLLVSGCATPPKDPGVADAPNDTCAVHRVAFRETKSSFDAGEAAVGALALGAAAGLAVGLVAGPRAGLAVGAGVAGAGLVATLIKDDISKKQAEEKRKALTEQTELVNRFGERVTGAHIALDRLTACRRQQVQSVRADYRAKRLPRPEAEQRLSDIRVWYEGDVTLVRAFDASLASDSKQLADSSRFIRTGGIEPEQVFRPFAGIMAVEGPAKQAPEDGANTVLTLQPGQKVQVASKDGNWLRVTLPNGRSGYVRAVQVARETAAKDFKGKASQNLRDAARDEAREVGTVATGNPYRVVGNMPGWLVVDQGAKRAFVRASALEPAKIDESGLDVVQATASAVSSRDAFANSATVLASDAQRLSLDG